MIRLYNYFRSSTSYRARIALHLKGIKFESVPVNLLKSEQRSPEYLKINPLGGVPALIEGGFTLVQSLAIIDYLEQKQPSPALYPKNPEDRALALQIAMSIAEDIHPVNNLKVQKYLAEEFSADDAAKKKWAAHWNAAGMKAVEAMLARSGRAGKFSVGDQVSVADLCIVPQMYSLRRFDFPVDEYPLCRRIEENCIKLKAFQDAAPEMQIDAPADLAPIHGPHAPLLKAAA